MSKRTLFALWGVMFIVCAALGFIPEPQGAVRFLLTALSVAFFVPPAWLLYTAGQTRDEHTRLLIRNLSALSLALTLVLLVGNVLSALTSEFLGKLLHTVLVIVSAPMICSGYWVLSLFLWACLLMASLSIRKGRKG